MKGYHGWKERHTYQYRLTCTRCGHEEKAEWFDSRSAWAAYSREVEDNRLEEVIRRAGR